MSETRFPDPACELPEGEELRVLRSRLVAYATRLAGGGVLDGRGPEEIADLALEKLERGVRRVGERSYEQVLFGAVRSLVHHARKREERRSGLDPEHAGAHTAPAVDPLHLRDALQKVAERLRAGGDADARAVVQCLIEHGGSYLAPRELAEVLGWRRERVYKAWERVKARFLHVWRADP